MDKGIPEVEIEVVIIKKISWKLSVLEKRASNKNEINNTTKITFKSSLKL